MKRVGGPWLFRSKEYILSSCLTSSKQLAQEQFRYGWRNSFEWSLTHAGYLRKPKNSEDISLQLTVGPMDASAKGLIYVISYHFQFNLDSGGAAPEKTSILGINMNNEVMKILKPAVHADCLDHYLFSKRNSSASVCKSLFFSFGCILSVIFLLSTSW